MKNQIANTKKQKLQFLHWKFNHGFTVVELLIYMGIFVILLSVLFAIFGSVLDTRLSTDSFSAVQQDGNYITARFAYDIQRASKVTIPSTLGGQATSLQFVIGGINYTYAVNASGNLQLTNNLGTFNINSYASTVSAFLVRRYGNISGVEDSLNISYTLISVTQNRSGPETRKIQTTIDLRRN